MSSTSKAWLAAASIGAVEALKDQMGVCRWNYAIRTVQQHLKNNVRSISSRPSASAPVSTTSVGQNNNKKAKQAEESLRTVMYLSCWAPT